jgi:hypothetical protein
MKLCDGCRQSNPATRVIRIETHTGSGRAVERNTCEDCYAALGQPETIAYICQDCGSESHRPDICTACATQRSRD